MYEEREAVRLILDNLQAAGLSWYRHAKTTEVDMFESRISGNFAIFDGGEHHNLPRKPVGSLPAKKILVMPPSGSEEEEILGLWLRWNFDSNPFAFRLFVGQWAKVDGAKTFIAFRFEAPETGDKHNFYHCQPCRNFGDKERVPNAALVSEHFPTIPINAFNIVELTVCALMACMGHSHAKAFGRKLLRNSAADNAPLKAAFARCCH
jgi:hypothetical protein